MRRTPSERKYERGAVCILVGITDVKLRSDLHFLAGTDELRWDHSESLAAARSGNRAMERWNCLPGVNSAVPWQS